MKTIFITGASTGLGRATALLFAENGWKVIATMRKPEIEASLQQNTNIKLMQLDVTNLNQINEVAQQVIACENVDVVFNNAGYGLAGPLEGVTDEQIVKQMNTNLMGVIRVTKAFVPFFRMHHKGMFITTTSIGGLVTFPFNSLYHATKWALEGFNESLAFELSAFGIAVKTVSPGGISTDFATRSLEMGVHEAYMDGIQKTYQVFRDPERRKHSSTAEQIAAIVYQAATDGKNQLRYVAGEDAKALYTQRLAVGTEPFRQDIAQLFLGTSL